MATTKTVYRSKKSGRFVTKGYAKKSPTNVRTQRVKIK